MKPLIFVAMPFGKKQDLLRRFEIDFDRIYEAGIKPAVERFDVECIRADEERTGGVIHLPMYERLLLAEIAVVDVTLSNPNVFYELGVRHAARPRSTIILASGDGPLPFDIAMIRAVPYKLTEGRLEDEDAKALADALAERLEYILNDLEAIDDSPLFQMIPQLTEQSLPHEITDAFRDRAREMDAVRRVLDAAKRLPRDEALAKVKEIESSQGQFTRQNAGLLLDIFLAYRDIEAFDEMVAFADKAPDWLKQSAQLLAEQQAFALNRRYEKSKDKDPADRKRAETILRTIIKDQGPSPETSGLLGRVYKSQYKEALAAGERVRANGFLNQAIDQYRSGFTADPRDYYPGINLVTLLASKGTADALDEFKRTVPAVSFALSRLGAIKSNDYWQVATVFELAVLGSDAENAMRALEIMETLDVPRWYFVTTRDNLEMLRAVSDEFLDKALLDEVAQELSRKIDSMAA